MNKRILIIITAILLLYLAGEGIKANVRRQNLNMKNPHNVRWGCKSAVFNPVVEIEVHYPRHYKGRGEIRAYLVHEEGRGCITPPLFLNQMKENPFFLNFPGNFPLCLGKHESDEKKGGFYRFHIMLDNKPVMGTNYGFAFFRDVCGFPNDSGKTDCPLVPCKKAEFYDFSDMPVNRIKENPDWKIKFKLKYTIYFNFCEYHPGNQRQYKGKGFVKMVIINSKGKKYISKTNKLSGINLTGFRFPKDFKTADLNPISKIENGYHHYYFIVDGVKIQNKQNSFIIIYNSDNKSIPTCNIIHFYDCRKLYREFFDKRRVVEKELNMK